MQNRLTDLKTRLAEINDLYAAAGLLEWDQQTYMPPGGAEARAAQLGTLHRLAHERFVADETGRLLEAARQVTDRLPGDSDDARLVSVTERDYGRERKLPATFVAELVQARALAHASWVRARQKSDFSIFKPRLERQFQLARRQADYLGYDEHPYDALLDIYEPDMKSSQIRTIFARLREQITGLLRTITADGGPIDDRVLRVGYDVEGQREFIYGMMRRFGYDFDRGRHDGAPHPFCTSFSRNDVRITGEIKFDDLSYFLFSALHETGHALYEQGISAALARSPLSQGTSLGVHESQSRLWENMVGRNRATWHYFYPLLQAAFPTQLSGVDLETFYRAINRVTPSFIRINADELTYSLHVMLRFELELDLLSGNLKVADLPRVWNEQMEATLGIVPPNDALGVLQDVHWSQGLIGYFPTYVLGNLMAAQWFAAAQQEHPALLDEFATGNFESLQHWLHDNIHVHGRKFTAHELLQRITGGALDARPYVDYLSGKFAEVYGLRSLR